MLNIIKYFLLLTTVMFAIVGCDITNGCYRQQTSPCSQHTLTCPDDQVISLFISRDINIVYGRNNPIYACRQDQLGICNATCCGIQGRGEDAPVLTPVNESDRLSVYRNCSNQRTYSPDTDYDYIAYPYLCLPVVVIYNMIEILDVSIQDTGYLYYSGTQTTGTRITRCCNITNPETITVQSVYIYLTEESSYNVKIYSDNQTLQRDVDESAILYGYSEVLISGDKICHVVLDNLHVEEDDYIWLRIESRETNSSITCDDCSGFTALGTGINSKNSSDEGTSNMVTSHMPTDGNNTNSSNEGNSTTTDKDRDNGGDVNTGLTVGIIVVSLLLLVTWFIGAVYCFRRKRTQHSRDGQNIERPVNTVETSTYADLVNNGGPEHGYSGLVNLNGPNTLNNVGPEHDHACTGNRSETVNNSGSEHGYINMVNRKGSDNVNNSDPEHSTVPNETEHHYTALGNPMHVPTDVNYENTLANTNY